MTQEQKQEIVNALKARLEETKLSANKAATIIGISPALLSQMNNGNWDNISDDKWRLAAKWAGLTNRWRMRETQNLTAITELCTDAKQNSRFAAIVGYTGAGKTTALEWFASKNANTYYLLCKVTMGRKEFLNGILRSMGLQVEGSIHQRVEAIVNYLKSALSPLLILDDAGKLPDPCLRLLQVIYDETKDVTGIIVAGVEHMKNYIFKMAAKDKLGFRELKSRVEYWLVLKGKVTRTFVIAAAAEFGINDTPAIEYIMSNADNYRDCSNILKNYGRFMEEKGEQAIGKTQREILAGIHFGTKDMEG
ncbi:hypothetical protein BH09BAC1_BH09BAC1_29710 [soil metagenome]